MTQFSYTIQDELGLHARPAGLLAKEAAKFKSTVTVESGDNADNFSLYSLRCVPL